jgi:hypothetical protein
MIPEGFEQPSPSTSVTLDPATPRHYVYVFFPLWLPSGAALYRAEGPQSVAVRFPASKKHREMDEAPWDSATVFESVSVKCLPRKF